MWESESFVLYPASHFGLAAFERPDRYYLAMITYPFTIHYCLMNIVVSLDPFVLTSNL